MNPPGVPARPQRPVSAAPKVEVHQGLGLPSVRNDGTGSGGVGKEAPTAPPRRAGAEIADGGMRRPESALEQHSTNKSSVPASARNPAPLAAPAPGMRGEGEVMRRVLNVQPPAEATQSFIPKKAAHATSSQAPPPAPAPVPEQPASEQDMQKPKKLSVLQMASNFAQVAEESSPALLPAPAPTRGAPPPAIAPSAIEVPTLKWLTSDRVLKVDGNTVVKASSNAASPAEEYGVAVADVVLSSGVHGSPPLPLFSPPRCLLAMSLHVCVNVSCKVKSHQVHGRRR